jgi:hypothetical protein
MNSLRGSRANPSAWQSLNVVPANAGTHNPGSLLLQKVSYSGA